MPPDVVPAHLARRRRALAVMVTLSVAIAAVVLWPAGDAAPVRTSLGGSGQRYVAPESYLAWVPGSFEDPDFRRKIESLEALREVVVVGGDTLWLERTKDAAGEIVDSPPAPFAFPIDAFSAGPRDYAPFVGASVRRQLVESLRGGEAVLGERSAELRRLDVGGTLSFRSGSVRVGAVVPDEAVGWAEVLVNRAVGHGLGIRHQRYLLAQPVEELSRPSWKRLVRPLVGDEPLRVDVPGGTRYVRVASGVNPPILLKEVFGEFAATPQADPAYLTIQPAWVDRNIVSAEVPLLGTVTCHRSLMPMVRGALQEVIDLGLASEIEVYSGCWASRTVARSSTAPPSFHAYGAAIDINAPTNPYGSEPTMNREVVG
ncbi:MAG: M15 family metallopeptidase, partial [Gemmatimonadota bacterium]